MSIFSFAGKNFPVNPSTFSIEHKRNVVRTVLPSGGEVLEDMGKACRVVTGEGMLHGTNLMQQYQTLQSDFLTPESGALVIAGLPSFTACCTSFSVTGQPNPNTLTFRFEFVEITEE